MLAEILLVLTNLFELNTQVTRRKGFRRKELPGFLNKFPFGRLFEKSQVQDGQTTNMCGLY